MMEASGRVGVLHVISGLGAGGAERMLLWSARYHDRTRIRMGVVSIMADGELAEPIRKEGVDVYELGQPRGKFSISAFRHLCAVVKKFDPHILQGHMFHSNILVRIIGSARSGAVVITTRHIDITSTFRSFINAGTGFLSDGVVVFSSRVHDQEKKENIFRRPIRLIPYGIEVPEPEDVYLQQDCEIRKEFQIPPDAFVWSAAGRLCEQKGFTDLLDAFSRLEETDNGPYLIIIGDGEDRRQLEDMSVEKGMGKRVFFTGYRDDVGRILRMTDAFVLSSLWEGGPLVVLEAMAAGLPVVATRVGDTPSMVEDGVSGILVEPGDPQQLSTAMRMIMTSGKDKGEWGLKGRKRVEEYYDFKNTQKKMDLFYLELAGMTAGD